MPKRSEFNFVRLLSEHAFTLGHDAFRPPILGIIELARAVNRLANAVQSVKEGKEEYSPQTPYKEKGKKPTTTTTRARARFVKPSVEEVAAYIRAKGYTFDAGRF